MPAADPGSGRAAGVARQRREDYCPPAGEQPGDESPGRPRQAGDALATTKGGLSLYRAEGKEVEYTADEGSTRRRSKTPNIPPYSEDW